MLQTIWCHCPLFWLPGSLTPDDLRKVLQNAVAQKDKPAIQRAISKCIAVGMPELDNDILQARKVLDMLKGTSGG